MSSMLNTIVLPAPAPSQNYVTVSALQAGHLTLPERLFVTDADPEKRATVPSLSFLIQHKDSTNSTRPSKLLFDLGLKRDLTGYRDAQQHHITQRQPTILHPDVADSLTKGDLTAEDIDTVILSHVHWDHVGTSSDFPNAQFLVGSGTLHILAHGDGPLYPASIFNPDELPRHRTREFPPIRSSDKHIAHDKQTNHTWSPLVCFPNAIDFFADGSLYVIDAPGHLTGHVNLLARIAPRKWVYLGGDCCHDPRILSGEKGIALYDDGKGGVRSVHMDTDSAARTVDMIRKFMGHGRVRDSEGREVEVEIVVAHDRGWAERSGERFWPGCL